MMSISWRVLSLTILLTTLFGYWSPANEAHGPEGGIVGTAFAIFAGGCFWCMEPPYDQLDGVVSTISGYIGGHKNNPTYQQVSAGNTGHAEAVKVIYDPAKVSYEKLLEVFWHNVDPTTPDRQFCDRGSQYRTGIFYHGEEQRVLAQASKTALEDDKPFAAPIVTELVSAGRFFPAEGDHQDYYEKNPLRYKFYRFHCGRDRRLDELWGDKDWRARSNHGSAARHVPAETSTVMPHAHSVFDFCDATTYAKP